MAQVAGIIYPSAFQVTELIGNLGFAFSSPQSSQYLRHKNLELGAWGAPIITNERKTIWAILDGQIYNFPELSEELKKLGF